MTVTTLPAPIAEAANWFDAAACRGMDPDMFFLPENARGSNKRRLEGAAKAVCAGCPVVQRCLKAALDADEGYGVFGGMTPEERVRLTGRVAV